MAFNSLLTFSSSFPHLYNGHDNSSHLGGLFEDSIVQAKCLEQHLECDTGAQIKLWLQLLLFTSQILFLVLVLTSCFLTLVLKAFALLYVK